MAGNARDIDCHLDVKGSERPSPAGYGPVVCFQMRLHKG